MTWLQFKQYVVLFLNHYFFFVLLNCCFGFFQELLFFPSDVFYLDMVFTLKMVGVYWPLSYSTWQASNSATGGTYIQGWFTRVFDWFQFTYLWPQKFSTKLQYQFYITITLTFKSFLTVAFSYFGFFLQSYSKGARSNYAPSLNSKQNDSLLVTDDPHLKSEFNQFISCLIKLDILWLERI